MNKGKKALMYFSGPVICEPQNGGCLRQDFQGDGSRLLRDWTTFVKLEQDRT